MEGYEIAAVSELIARWKAMAEQSEALAEGTGNKELKAYFQSRSSTFDYCRYALESLARN